MWFGMQQNGRLLSWILWTEHHWSVWTNRWTTNVGYLHLSTKRDEHQVFSFATTSSDRIHLLFCKRFQSLVWFLHYCYLKSIDQSLSVLFVPTCKIRQWSCYDIPMNIEFLFSSSTYSSKQYSFSYRNCSSFILKFKLYSLSISTFDCIDTK